MEQKQKEIEQVLAGLQQYVKKCQSASDNANVAVASDDARYLCSHLNNNLQSMNKQK